MSKKPLEPRNRFALTLVNNVTQSPKVGFKWKILGGTIVHVTGTPSTLSYNIKTIPMIIAVIGSDIPSVNQLPLCSIVNLVIAAGNNVVAAPAQLPIENLKHDSYLRFTGDANATCYLDVLEEMDT